MPNSIQGCHEAPKSWTDKKEDLKSPDIAPGSPRPANCSAKLRWMLTEYRMIMGIVALTIIARPAR